MARTTDKTKIARDLFAKRLRVRMAELGWRAPDVAAELRRRGIDASRQKVNDWARVEDGAYPLGPAAALLPSVLGVTAEWLFVGEIEGGEGGEKRLLAARVARVIEHCILTGDTPTLSALALWIERLAEDLVKIDPTYDTEELKRDAAEIRRMIG